MTTTEIREQPAAPTGSAEPAWEVALLFPPQGEWSAADYLALDTNRLVELVDGRLEVLPMPTKDHQRLVRALFRALDAFVTERRLGEAFFAPLPVYLWERHYREPDLLFMRTEALAAEPGDHCEHPDLVVEVISPDGRDRDLVEKRADYARACIPEYLIVDPEKERILVLALDGDVYRVPAEFERGAKALSVTLEGFSVSVDGILDADG